MGTPAAGNQESIDRFLRNAWSLGRIAYRSSETMRSDNSDEWLDALVVTAVFGRSVSQALARLKNLVPGFDEWWAPYAHEMATDPLCRWMNTIRNGAIKEGTYPRYSRRVEWHEVNIMEAPWPEPDSVSMTLTTGPESHLGEPITDLSPQALSGLYLSYLEKLTLDAQERFGSPPEFPAPASPTE